MLQVLLQVDHSKVMIDQFLVVGRGRGRAVAPAPIQEFKNHQPPPVIDRQRRGTFVLEEPSLPNLPQSGAQRPRDTVRCSRAL